MTGIAILTVTIWAVLATLTAAVLWLVLKATEAEATELRIDRHCKKLGLQTREQMAVRLVTAEMRACEAEAELKAARWTIQAVTKELDRAIAVAAQRSQTP